LGAAASIALATGFGVAASLAGLLLSYHGNMPSGPAIVLSAGALFGMSSILAGILRRVTPVPGWGT
jgi:zinc/manganese transport system permease protein